MDLPAQSFIFRIARSGYNCASKMPRQVNHQGAFLAGKKAHRHTCCGWSYSDYATRQQMALQHLFLPPPPHRLLPPNALFSQTTSLISSTIHSFTNNTSTPISNHLASEPPFNLIRRKRERPSTSKPTSNSPQQQCQQTQRPSRQEPLQQP